MKLLTAMIAAVGLLAIGCASPRAETVALEPMPEFKVSYSGELGRHLVGDLPEYTPAESETDVLFALEVRILRGTAAQTEALFGRRSQIAFAWSMEPEALGEHGLTLVTAPRLTVFEGQSGTISVTNEVAFVSGFECYVRGFESGGGVGTPGSRIVSPVVDTILDGLVLGLKAVSADEKQMRLSVDLTLAEIVKPIATQQINVLGAPVTIQTPVIYNQRIKGEGVVSEDRVLVLTGMANAGDVYVVLITGKRAKAD